MQIAFVSQFAMTVGFWKPHKQGSPAKPYSEVYVSALLFATQLVNDGEQVFVIVAAILLGGKT